MEHSESDLWTPENEIKLFHAIINHKPVGADRHFQMIYICNMLNSLNNHITTDAIWKKLNSLYNMEELHDSEINPFQSKVKEFVLPNNFDELKSLKFPRVAGSQGAASRFSSVDSPTNYQKRTRKSLRSTDVSSTSGDVSSANSSASSTPVLANREKRR